MDCEHLFDFAISAAWIENRSDQLAMGTPKKEIIDNLYLRIQYEDYLRFGNVQRYSDSEDEDFEHRPDLE